MLKKFSVTNFKNFKDKVTFDLGNSRNYKFNEKCIKDNIVNKSIIYGKNASGKTNLILGIFDIVNNLTDYYANAMQYNMPQYNFYKNLLNNVDDATEFEYEFYLNSKLVQYIYKKKDHSTFVSEKLLIDDQLIIDRDTKASIFTINIPGLENFDNTLNDVKLSVVKYIYKNTKIKDLNNEIAKTFVMFISFVEKMLMFYSLSSNGYVGFQAHRPENVCKKIVDTQKVKDFELFLKNFDLDYELTEIKDNVGQPSIGIKYGNQTVEFHQIVSSGTRALLLFYYWYISIEKLSLMAIDEFDAFYDNKLSERIVKLLIESNCQVILTTHNTSVMTNELMRPDCYFKISKNEIVSLANVTDIEIREAHNLEKIYRSGWFDEER